MHEDFLYYLWTYQVFTGELVTTTGEIINVISPGSKNKDSGPDFFNALIDIGSTRWAGNVEIHTKSSHWFTHNHHLDETYDSIILHVVNKDDLPIKRSNGELIYTLELEDKYDPNIYDKYKSFINSKQPIPCGYQLSTLKTLDVINWFDNLIVERLENKSKMLTSTINFQKGDLLETSYQWISKSFGYKTNATAMELLAKSTPIRLLLKHIDNIVQIEALLFGQSGLLNNNLQDFYTIQLKKEYEYLKRKYNLTPMNPSIWKFMRMRPASFPTIRISQLANFLFQTSASITNIVDIGSLDRIKKLLTVSASSYWNNHYRFGVLVLGKEKKLGSTTIVVILINSIIPLVFEHGNLKNKPKLQDKALKWLTQLESESNSITETYKSFGLVPTNALDSQAMIQLWDNYCLKKRCLNCRFGNLILNKD